jgi:hypothetical protein
MTPAWIAFVSLSAGAAAALAFYSGCLVGHRRGYQVGHRAGWEARRFAYDRDTAEVTVVMAPRRKTS